MFRDQFGIKVVVPCVPQVRRAVASQLFPGVASDLQKGDEDECGAVGGDEIAM